MLRERAVAMVFEVRAETGTARGAIARVGHRPGVNTENLRNWVQEAEADSGQRRARRVMIRSGSRSWSGKSGNCGGRDPEGGEWLFRPGTRPQTSALVGFIDSHKDRFDVEPACAVPGISPSTYYSTFALSVLWNL